MADRAIKRALIAVYDKTGVTEFARALVDEFGIEIISTGGTAKHLKDAGVPVTMVEQVTGFPEMLDGRLKTLHPKIHAGILADRDNPDHMRHLAEHGIQPIDMVVVNLYPFEKTVADPNCTFEQAIEMIDIGGPCMLRAAAKNHRHVLVVISSREYSRVLDLLRANHLGELSIQSRWNAIQLFRVTSSYDRHIFDYLIGEHMSRDGVADGQELHPEVAAARSHRMMMPQLGWPDPLRYGENPHQQAQFASFSNGGESLDLRVDLESWGKDTRNAGNTLSYNNLVDGDAALGLCAEIARGTEQLHAPAVWHRLIAGATRLPLEQS